MSCRDPRGVMRATDSTRVNIYIYLYIYIYKLRRYASSFDIWIVYMNTKAYAYILQACLCKLYSLVGGLASL